MRRVAILGSAEASMRQVPWDDKGLEMWGLAWRMETLRRCDMGFEIHRPPWRPHMVGANYVERMAKCGKPIVMFEPHPDIPNSVRFPHEEAAKLGGDYFTSSVSYMIAYAILEAVDEIHIYGVDMVTSGEYEYQRPGAEYWLGVARGRGIEVFVADASALLRANFKYGETRISEAGTGAFTVDFLQNRIDNYDKRLKEIGEKAATFNGGQQECQSCLNLMQNIADRLPSKGVAEAVDTLTKRLGQYGHQMRMIEAEGNTTNGAKQEASAMRDFQAHADRGGVIPGAGLGAINAARIDSGSPEGEDPVLPARRGGVPVELGPGPHPDVGGNGAVPSGERLVNGTVAEGGDGSKPNGRGPEGVVVHPKRRSKGPREEGAEEGAGAVA